MKDYILIEFGSNLQKLRLSRKLSQEELGLKAELDRTYISGVERGKRNLSLINLFKISKALDIPPSELLRFYDECNND